MTRPPITVAATRTDAAAIMTLPPRPALLDRKMGLANLDLRPAGGRAALQLEPLDRLQAVAAAGHVSVLPRELLAAQPCAHLLSASTLVCRSWHKVVPVPTCCYAAQKCASQERKWRGMHNDRAAC